LPSRSSLRATEYLRLGVRCVWIFDLAERCVQVHTRDVGPDRRIATAELGEGDVLDGRDVLPGFRQPLAELFLALYPPA
jgi:Uma2 family endonuclease